MKIDVKPIYPSEPWRVSEKSFDMANNYRNETTFALSNGYIGTRGTFEESYDFGIDIGLEGNFINGFYDSEPIRYGEECFGFPKNSQTMLNVMNAKAIRLFADGEPFDLRTGTIQEYCRTLHMDKGLVTRDVLWTSPAGKQLRLHTERLASFADKHLMAIRYEVTPINFSGSLRLISELDCDVLNHTRTTNPLIDYGPYERSLLMKELRADADGLYALCHTNHSGLSIATLCVEKTSSSTAELLTEGLLASASYTIEATQGQIVCMEKFIAYTTSQDETESAFEGTLREAVQLGLSLGFAEIAKKQKAYLDEFWNVADVRVEGDDSLQQGLRFNLFHIMQAAGRDGHTGMGAKGLSGEGYEGHYFWDSEMYVMPVFTHTFPEISKKLLDYRYNTLEQARARAREMGHPKGALYPWRTINGTEASSYYPLGTAQYHINADVAYGFRQYVAVTDDIDYLAEKAAEVLCETARVWADVGCFAEARGGKYCICCVTGPDEYNALVDNNFYTNLMARENIRDALGALKTLTECLPQAYHALVEKLKIQPEETKLWAEIVEKMYLPYDEQLGVYPQDDGFLQRKPWDESRIPLEKRHLLFENYHPLFVFRHRMCKQADAIFAMFLHDRLFTKAELKRNFDYYQTVTLHHSSLSTCVFGMLACEIGYPDLAYEYFSHSARMDLDDYHENFYAGIHAANMAGTWLAIVNGFAGMRTAEGLAFAPFLPKNWKGYAFRVNYRGALLDINVRPDSVTYTLLSDVATTFSHRGKSVELKEKGASSIEKI